MKERDLRIYIRSLDLSEEDKNELLNRLSATIKQEKLDDFFKNIPFYLMLGSLGVIFGNLLSHFIL